MYLSEYLPIYRMNPLDPYKYYNIIYLNGFEGPFVRAGANKYYYNVICVSYNIIILQCVRSMHRLLIARGVHFDGDVEDVW